MWNRGAPYPQQTIDEKEAGNHCRHVGPLQVTIDSRHGGRNSAADNRVDVSNLV